MRGAHVPGRVMDPRGVTDMAETEQSPTALVTGIAMLVLAVGSDVIMPGLVSHNTVRYGLIGFTFSLVSWLFSAALLVVAAAILGALLDRTPWSWPRRGRIVRSG
jgi:hypothetical protein